MMGPQWQSIVVSRGTENAGNDKWQPSMEAAAAAAAAALHSTTKMHCEFVEETGAVAAAARDACGRPNRKTPQNLTLLAARQLFESVPGCHGDRTASRLVELLCWVLIRILVLRLGTRQASIRCSRFLKTLHPFEISCRPQNHPTKFMRFARSSRDRLLSFGVPNAPLTGCLFTTARIACLLTIRRRSRNRSWRCVSAMYEENPDKVSGHLIHYCFLGTRIVLP